jgi:hypothetical protein
MRRRHLKMPRLRRRITLYPSKARTCEPRATFATPRDCGSPSTYAATATSRPRITRTARAIPATIQTDGLNPPACWWRGHPRSRTSSRVARIVCCVTSRTGRSSLLLLITRPMKTSSAPSVTGPRDRDAPSGVVSGQTVADSPRGRPWSQTYARQKGGAGLANRVGSSGPGSQNRPSGRGSARSPASASGRVDKHIVTENGREET